MSVIRIQKHKNNFVILDKTCLRDASISWRAKGIHAYLISCPDDWVVRVESLKDLAKEGREAVRGAIKELVEVGYMHRHIVRDKETGQVVGSEYIVTEEPETRPPVPPSATKEGKEARIKKEGSKEGTPVATAPEETNLASSLTGTLHLPPPNYAPPPPPPSVQNCTTHEDALGGARGAGGQNSLGDAADARERKPRKKQTWLTAYDEAWFARTGGHLAFTVVSKGLKRFESDHGKERALEIWRNFCAKAPKDEFHTINTFLRNPAPWMPQSKSLGATERL
jgi:hypothetical protein